MTTVAARSRPVQLCGGVQDNPARRRTGETASVLDGRLIGRRATRWPRAMAM